MNEAPPTFKFAIRSDLDQNFTPKKSHSNDTGWDVSFAPHDNKSKLLYSGEWFMIPLGFKVFAPPGWWLELRPRSSTVAKKHIHPLYGVIDEGFEGEVHFVGQFIAQHGEMITLSPGDRIGQLIPYKRQEMHVEVISNEEFETLTKNRSNQRTGGFGSTGK